MRPSARLPWARHFFRGGPGAGPPASATLSRLLPALAVLTLVLPACRPAAGPAPVDAGTVGPTAAYREVAELLEPHVRVEMERHDLPAVALALVDDQEIVWAAGFGTAEPLGDETSGVTARTIFRVGSVSKLFTDIAVMQRVEAGEIDLDAPVTRWLPEFRPDGPLEAPGGAEAARGQGLDAGGDAAQTPAVTLRQLMSHTSGLVREPPVGHYFDPTEPSLEATVASLRESRLVYPPGSRTKYSNAGIATVGRVLEVLEGGAFADLLARDVLAPLGMDDSAFESGPAVRERLAGAVMWTLDGREFAAPTFELGMAPAGSMYSTVTDLGRFLSALFAGGRGPGGRIVRPETLESMWTPRGGGTGGSGTGFGIGFAINQLDGHRRVGHGGAIYGFATELAALPDERLGVAAVTTRDIANPVVEGIADAALRAMLAARAGEPLPQPEATAPLYEGLADRIAGRDQHFAPTAPPAPPDRWLELIGTYGWDHDTLYVLEMGGRLHALIEWFFLYPLTEVEADVFRFPDSGLYAGERLVFRRDGAGEVVSADLEGVVFERRLGAAEGDTFRIDPVRPVEELRQPALEASPPAEEGDFREPELVDPTELDPTIRLDIRYATTNNFMGAVFYRQPRTFLQRPAAEALVQVSRSLRERGYGLLIHDAYRPWYVTKMFFDATPEEQRIFVADPASGSRHNRGSAVDLTLYDLETGEPVDMTGGYDEFTERSYPDYPGGTHRQRWHRELLRAAMEAEGFSVYEFEWWHFDHRDWREYPILNLTFEEIETTRVRRPQSKALSERFHRSLRDAHLRIITDPFDEFVTEDDEIQGLIDRIRLGLRVQGLLRTVDLGSVETEVLLRRLLPRLRGHGRRRLPLHGCPPDGCMHNIT